MAQQTEAPKPESDGQKKSRKADLIARYESRFEDAVADAQYMMFYASTNCPNDIDKDSAKKLIEVRQSITAGVPLSADAEAEFWLNYQNLWKLVQPASRKDFTVTAESIKANMPLEKTFFGWLLGYIPALSHWTENWTISKSRRMVNRYIIFTGLILILLLVFQIYWVIGNQLFVQINDLLKAEEDLKVQVNENPQIDVKKDSDSLESQLLLTSLMVLDWSRPWHMLITTRDSGPMAEYAQKYADINTEIKKIENQLLDEAGIKNAAENDPVILNLLQNAQAEMKIALIAQKSTLDGKLASLDAQKEEIQGKIDEQKQRRVTLLENLNQVKIDREDSIAKLTDQKSSLSAQLVDINAQLIGLMPTATSEASHPPPPSDTSPLPDEENQSKIQVLGTDKVSILHQIDDINNLLQTQVESTQATDIQGQIDAIDKQLIVTQDLSANIDVLKNDLRGQLTGNMNVDAIQKKIDEMSNPNDTLASQLVGLDAAREVIQGQIESLQSKIDDIQITVPEDKKKQVEEVAARIVGELEQKKQQLMDEKETLQRQEAAEQENSIKEDSRPAQLAGRFVLDILQNYLLPLLYGILGASIFVLRSLSRYITNVTYSDVPGIRHVVHIALGALAGILVGWFAFLIPSDSVIGSVSPLAIAFLVGYNIELVFTKMDDIVVTKLREIRQRTSLGPAEANQKATSANTLPVEPTQETPSGEVSAPKGPAS